MCDQAILNEFGESVSPENRSGRWPKNRDDQIGIGSLNGDDDGVARVALAFIRRKHSELAVFR
jgi:hypothetical protein